MTEFEKHSDQCDIASDNEERYRNEAMRIATKQVPVPSDFDGEHCVECELTIPQGRLDLGKFTCVDCQASLEKQKKFFRKG